MPASGYYRNDIDGLRALAITAVVIYHVFPRALPGGFCGVDVFFVISGFLITGQFSRREIGLTAFYARRVRRLAPALLCVLLGTLLLGTFVLLPNELSALGRDSFAGVTFFSNLFSWHEQGYFDRTAALKPLLHLWSLGIEEQFYLLWPILILIGMRTRRLSLGWLVAGTFALSFTFSLWCTFFAPDAGFYWPISRMWEFMLGAALVVGAPAVRSLGSHWRTGLSWLGLASLGLSVLVLSPTSGFPAPLAACPTLAVMLLIAAGPKTWLAQRVLASPPMRTLGLISYPLYLWHWPLLAYEHILHGLTNQGRRTGYVIIALSVVLAALTNRFIEAPLRWRTPARPTLCGLLAGLFATGCLGLALWAWPGLLSQQSRHGTDINIESISIAEQDGIFPVTPNMTVEHVGSITLATIGPSIGNPILFTGDSLLFQWAPHIDALFSEGKLAHTVIFVAGPSCAPLPVEHYATEFRFCKAMSDLQDRILTTYPIRKIVMGAFWQRVFSLDPAVWPARKAQAEARIRTLRDGGKREVTIILPTPANIHFDPANMVQRSFSNIMIDASTLRAGVPMSSIRTGGADFTALLESIAHDTQVSTLDLTEEICGSRDACFPLMDNGTPKFADEKHLRPVFTQGRLQGLDRLLTH
ncbi:acyltransferase family protein [Acetobacter conturbans]|nr:acyltransferase family protein [Acetobacter conturbans]